jgi:hypothetical protein
MRVESREVGFWLVAKKRRRVFQFLKKEEVKMRRVSLIIFFVCLITMVNVASAAIYWVGGEEAAVWNDSDNWNTAADGSGTYRLPTAGDDTQINGNASVTLDITAEVNTLRFGVTPAGTQVFNVGSGTSVTAVGTSAEIISVGYLASPETVTVNQTGGTVKAYVSGGGANTRLGEVRIGRTATTAATYNLSGGTLDTEMLREGGNGYPSNLNDTGGTIVVRTAIRQFGSNDNTWDGANKETWTQKQSTFAPGGVGELAVNYLSSGEGTIYIGYDRPTTWLTSGTNAYTECYRSSEGTTVALDFVDADSYDNISEYGYASFAAVGDILNLNFTVGGNTFTPDIGETFDVWRIVTNQAASRGGAATGFSGSGYFATVNDTLGISNDVWMQGWISSGGYNNTILRLTYLPEPATIALLGLGLLALVRRPRRK